MTKFGVMKSVVQELYSILEDHKGRLARLKERCKDQLDKKIDDISLKRVSSLLFKGVVWLARQQNDFIDHLKMTLGDNFETEEAKYKSATAQPLGSLSQVYLHLLAIV